MVNSYMNNWPAYGVSACTSLSYGTATQAQQSQPPKKGWVRTMFDGVKAAVSEFFTEYRTVILWMATLFLLDHFFFAGKFRQRLYDMVEKMITKVESKVAGVLA